jgi:hypothetical protein
MPWGLPVDEIRISLRAKSFMGRIVGCPEGQKKAGGLHQKPLSIPRRKGPDAATVVDSGTKNAMILGFFTPETSRETMVLGVQEAADLLLTSVKGEAENPVILP